MIFLLLLLNASRAVFKDRFQDGNLSKFGWQKSELASNGREEQISTEDMG